jgi:S1-C subfamily serine protease
LEITAVLYRAIAVVLLVLLTTVPCAASNREDCENTEKPVIAIPACSHLLKSKSLGKIARSQHLVSRALAYYFAGNYQAALADSDEAIRLTPDRAVTHTLRAYANEGLGKRVEALEDAKKAITRALRDREQLRRYRIMGAVDMAYKKAVQKQIDSNEGMIKDLKALEARLQAPGSTSFPPPVGPQMPPAQSLPGPTPSPQTSTALTAPGLFDRVVNGVVLVATESGTGAGVIISSAGDILTNVHVVGNHPTVSVAFYKRGEVYQSDFVTARVVKTDPSKDLALLRLDQPPSGLTVFQMSALGALSIGDEVNAIGHPEGALWSFTRGYISQIRTNFHWNVKGRQHWGDVIQTQTPINPGNSGGPLFDSEGKLVGINTFISTQTVGIHWAVAVSEIAKFNSNAPVLSQPPVPTKETTALSLIKDYFNALSTSDDKAMQFLEANYTGQVMYFGKTINRSDVLAEKRMYFERWPHRTYRMRTDELTVKCQSAMCSVSGGVDWWVGSPVRHDWKRGTAVYHFEVVFIGSVEPFIQLENSSVTQRESTNEGAPNLEPEGQAGGRKQVYDRILPEP